MKKTLLTCALALSLASCTKPVMADTTLPLTSKLTRELLVKVWAQALDYTPCSSSEFTLVFSKRCDSFVKSLLYGSSFNIIPESRITFTLIDTPDGVFVISKAEIVTNPNSGFEKISMDLTKKEETDKTLDYLRDVLIENLTEQDQVILKGK